MNSGIALTMQSIFTTVSTRSSEPKASRVAESKLQPDDAGALVGLLDRHLGADLARHQVAARVARPLPGQEQQIAGHAISEIVRNRRRHLRQRQAKFFQTGFSAHDRFLS